MLAPTFLLKKLFSIFFRGCAMYSKLFSIASILVLTLLLVNVSGFAQTATNVEQASRFRVSSDASTLNTTSATGVENNVAGKVNIPDFTQKSSSQLEVMGSRYGYATSNSQLSELGSRYGYATSNSQLSELGSRYGYATSNSQLSELGSRYGYATSNSQLSELGSRYGYATSNSQLN